MAAFIFCYIAGLFSKSKKNPAAEFGKSKHSASFQLDEEEETEEKNQNEKLIGERKEQKNASSLDDMLAWIQQRLKSRYDIKRHLNLLSNQTIFFLIPFPGYV